MPAMAVQVSSIREEKDALRRKMRAERDRLPPSEREERGAAAAARLLAHPALAGAKLAALFWAAHGELDTASLARALWERKIRLALPKVEGGQILFLETPAEDALRPGPFGLLEPRSDLPMVPLTDLEFMLVPGLAFDSRGWRLGYGKGLYDRVLGRLRSGTVTAGYCFDFQLLGQVPHGPTDLPVGEIVTDRRHLRCGETS